MESIKFIFRTLQRNNFAKSTVKFLLPGKIANNIKKHFNEDKRFKIYFENKLIIIDQKSTKIQGIIPVFYWDGEPNFGDTIGPFLISNITGKPVLNIYNNKIPGLMAVGSIIQLINRKNMTIWGSGLIEKPTDKLMKDIKKYNPKVLSVRGKETAKVLLEAGITIPDESVFGDPALILPLFYKPITRAC